MFGFIKPCRKSCTKKQRAEYKKYYCGLCFALGNNYGKSSRILLNYDLTNEYLLLSLYSGEHVEKQAVCPFSWRKKKVSYYYDKTLLDYLSKLNYLLVYYKLLDNVRDINSLFSGYLIKKMDERAKQTGTELSDENRIITEHLDILHSIEEKNSYTPVIDVAGVFGELLCNAINPPVENEIELGTVRSINYWTGVWIYTIDAVMDCQSDYYRKTYNPITAGIDGDALDTVRARRREILDILYICKDNILSLIDGISDSVQAELLRSLFNTDLPFNVRFYLEVSKNEFNAQTKTKTSV